MQKKCKKFGMGGLLLFLMLMVVGFSTICLSVTKVQAATAGFQTVNGKTYYYDSDGKKHTGWLVLNGKKYYFQKSTGEMVKGYMKDSEGHIYYFFRNNGSMATGWVTNSAGQKLYFNPNTGYLTTGWQKLANGKKRYFDKNTGAMATGWKEFTGGKKRYFYKSTGYMATGLVKTSNGKYRYFNPSTGVLTYGYVTTSKGTRYFYNGTGYMATGWVKSPSGIARYFKKTNGYMCVGTVKINGYICEFDKNGLLLSKTKPGITTTPTSERTIKNYLAGALQPVGQALYVWGGGWNSATLKGVNPTWKTWYNNQSSSYDYNNYRDLSESTRSKGLDCSGFVGWAAYQVMQTQSGIGDGYTVVSGDIGSHYKSMGWGRILTQANLSSSGYTLKPGDVGYNAGHTWIVIGQCVDKSLVIVHSTPQAGCQIAGTPTPDGKYPSRAIALAEKYMKKYPGYYKYDYHTSSGHYIKNGNYFRWNRTTLADPDGYLNMNAQQILEDLFKK